VAFAIAQHDTVSFDYHHDTLDESTFHDGLSAIPISGSGTQRVRLGLTAGAVAADLPVTVVDTVAFSDIRAIVFDNASKPLRVTVADSTSLTIENLAITLSGFSPAVAGQPLGTLTSGQSKSASFAVAGSSIDSTVIVQISGTLRAPGNIGAGDRLIVSFTLDSLTAYSATVIDSLVSFADTFTNYYKITDTVDIDYVDILEGFFTYSMQNNTGLDFGVTGIHQHLWTSSACQNPQHRVARWEELGALANHEDSVNYYSGEITQGERIIPAKTDLEFGRLNLSGNRLFPQWDPVKQRSVTRVDYILRTTPPRGDWVTVSKGD
jgi:hypothetical protein